MTPAAWLALTVAVTVPALILATYCAIMALTAQRPAWRDVPALTWAIWHAGQAFVWSGLLLLAGGLFGLAARAAWKIIAF